MARTPKLRENEAYRAVLNGELRIDNEGRVWRLAARRWDRWTGRVKTIPCPPRRAENRVAGGYLQVRVMFDGQRIHALAHRLVYRHFFGPIPDGITINHRNGIKDDNLPGNLEQATNSEQAIHALRTLKRGRIDQSGSKNAMSKLTTEQVTEIKRRRAAGEKLRQIASDFNVTFQTISGIARGKRRQHG